MNFEDYSGKSDEELITVLRDGDNNITDYLMEKYKDLVKTKAKSMYILGADNDDLIQEGMIGLFKAIRDYDPGRDASFFTFAKLCISRQMYTAIEASNRMKNMPLNTYVSLTASNLFSDDEEDKKVLEEVLEATKELGPEEQLIDNENVIGLMNKIHPALSDFEKSVLELKITGMNYVEIAQVLGKDAKSTDNALGRIKTKVKKILEEM